MMNYFIICFISCNLKLRNIFSILFLSLFKKTKCLADLELAELILITELDMVTETADSEVTDSAADMEISMEVTETVDSEVTETVDSEVTETVDSEVTETVDSEVMETVDSEVTETVDSEVMETVDSEVTGTVDSEAWAMDCLIHGVETMDALHMFLLL
jgi:hypothetical protein